MNEEKEIEGTYGSGQTPCTVFVYNGWYCVEDSINVNYTPETDLLVDGVDVETLEDTDCFTWSSNIETLEQLIAAVEA